ncbi:MAG: 1,4-dihydroxy-2-naphthoate polyprenyltransferase [Myxococcota bacterium]
MAAVTASTSGPRGWRIWWIAARPRTLPVAIAPVIVGSALAQAGPGARALPAAAALCTALLLQIGANLANDLFDHQKGVDGADRIGPPRAMQLGLLDASAMGRGMLAVFGAAALCGLYLVWIGGWPIALVGALSIAAALAYSGGPFALGDHGLGDLAVFLFFGVIAVCGSYYVQALCLPLSVLVISLPVGALATAVLVVNNIRDLDSDARAGKRTLAVHLGPRASRIEFALLTLLPFVVPAALAVDAAAGITPALPLLLLPWAIGLVRRVWTSRDGPALNAALAATARLELGFCGLLALGFLV